MLIKSEREHEADKLLLNLEDNNKLIAVLEVEFVVIDGYKKSKRQINSDI